MSLNKLPLNELAFEAMSLETELLKSVKPDLLEKIKINCLNNNPDLSDYYSAYAKKLGELYKKT